jgi:tetratricopeptide (TPR) repeat protein
VDKAEYKIATEQIKKLISQGEYAEASHIADTIDWTRVKSVMMLCTVSDLYKVNRRYEDAKELLYMAYERNPESRTILYSLCDLSIKLEEFVAAIEYYKAFVETAPRDTGRYVLQYRLYQAQDVSLEERIEVLEQLKHEEYIEKWAYELAYLYHRIGFATKCVEECDELILWFGDGKYVERALELKMIYQPLNKLQEDKYRRIKQHKEGYVEVSPYDELRSGEIVRETVKIPRIQSDAGRFNTINLQSELAKSMQQIMDATEPTIVNDTMKNSKEMVGVVKQTNDYVLQEEPIST